MSNLGFEQTLTNDYDNFMRFCLLHHAEESLKFWTDVEDFRTQALGAFPPPPSPTAIQKEPFKFARRMSFLGTSTPNSAASSPEVTRVSSLSRNGLLNKMSDLSISFKPPSVKEASMETSEEIKKFRETAMESVNGGSSFIRMQISLSRNLALKLGKENIPLLELARGMVFKYLDVNSPHAICLPQELIDSIEDRVENGDLSADLFDEAQQLVASELKLNMYPLYLKKSFVDVSQVPPPPERRSSVFQTLSRRASMASAASASPSVSTNEKRKSFFMFKT